MARTRRTREERVSGTASAAFQDAKDDWASHWAGPARTPVVLPKFENDAQTSLRLPDAMYRALKASADAHDVRIGEEIRSRLELSFEYQAQTGSDETRKLLQAIAAVSREIEPAFGIWHQNPFAFEAFRSAVLTLIDLNLPAGDAARPLGNEVADFYLGKEGTSETAGRMLASTAAVAAGIPLPGQRRRKERS